MKRMLPLGMARTILDQAKQIQIENECDRIRMRKQRASLMVEYNETKKRIAKMREEIRGSLSKP